MTKRSNKRLQVGFIACAAQWKLFLLRRLQTRIIQKEVNRPALILLHFPYMKRFTAHHMKRLKALNNKRHPQQGQTCVHDSPDRRVCHLCTCRSNMCEGFIPQSRGSGKEKMAICVIIQLLLTKHFSAALIWPPSSKASHISLVLFKVSSCSKG